MTHTDAKELINKVEHKLFGISANNYFNYQVRYHLEEFKASGKYADVLEHYINHKPLYLHHRVFYFNGMIIDRNQIKTELYSKICRHKVWKKISRVSNKSKL
jgi:hypothetical protein